MKKDKIEQLRFEVFRKIGEHIRYNYYPDMTLTATFHLADAFLDETIELVRQSQIDLLNEMEQEIGQTKIDWTIFDSENKLDHYKNTAKIGYALLKNKLMNFKNNKLKELEKE